jgi:hypothetical protein
VTSRRFENQKALQGYAEANELTYVWEGMKAFPKRWRLAQLAQPGMYELVDVRTTRGVTRALLFPKAILRAEFEAAEPMREAMIIKRERLRRPCRCRCAAGLLAARQQEARLSPLALDRA